MVFFVLSGSPDPVRVAEVSNSTGIIPVEDYKVYATTHKGKHYQVETFRSGPLPRSDDGDRKRIKERFIVTVPLRFRDGALLELLRVGLGRLTNCVISDLPDL